jgi:hypothetical protein
MACGIPAMIRNVQLMNGSMSASRGEKGEKMTDEDALQMETITSELIGSLRQIMEQTNLHETHRRRAQDAIDAAFQFKEQWVYKPRKR